MEQAVPSKITQVPQNILAELMLELFIITSSHYQFQGTSSAIKNHTSSTKYFGGTNAGTDLGEPLLIISFTEPAVP